MFFHDLGGFRDAQGASCWEYFHFLESLTTFTGFLHIEKMSESTRFFFQQRHIEYVLSIKNVTRVRKAAETRELVSGKNVNT